MRKKGICAICALTMILATSCVSFVPRIPDGRWESDSPKMYIETGVPISTLRTGVADKYEDVGGLYNDDGTITKLFFVSAHGSFSIWKYHADGNYQAEEGPIYTGFYELKDDTLTLKLQDGTEIVLTRVGEQTEQNMEIPEESSS